nr:MAG TPA: hypothetical protein [Caudoviricetes sp.]
MNLSHSSLLVVFNSLLSIFRQINFIFVLFPPDFIYFLSS